jgi:hypothetical protein
MTPEFERAMTVHALSRAATMELWLRGCMDEINVQYEAFAVMLLTLRFYKNNTFSNKELPID